MPPSTVERSSHVVATHIHTDGPIPGPHSLLSMASAAYRADGVPAARFRANVAELPGAGPHPTALHAWRGRAEDWLCTRRAARPPAVVANAYADWVTALGGRPAFVVGPDGPDLLFCYWYLQRFAGRWPFAATVPAALLGARFDARPLCALTGCRGDTLARAAG